GRRKVDRQDIEALFGQPYAVASLPVGNRKCATGFGQQRFLLSKKCVGGGAEDVIGSRKTRLPLLKLAHRPAPDSPPRSSTGISQVSSRVGIGVSGEIEDGRSASPGVNR